jgi:splicing factor U2AF 65 kDa subunit
MQVLLNNGAGGLNAAMAANKKQREVYVGNLVIGSITDLMLRELFNAALAHFVADPVTRPPVVSVTMDGSGRFGFVELRTEELAAEAMKLDKVRATHGLHALRLHRGAAAVRWRGARCGHVCML